MKYLINTLVFGASIAFVSSLGACKQAKGERCQVAADCEEGLVCNQATQTCQDTTGTGIDATVPDGHPVLIDAMLDAPDAI